MATKQHLVLVPFQRPEQEKNKPAPAQKKGNEEGIKPVGERQMMCHVAMEGTAAAALIITNIIIIIS